MRGRSSGRPLPWDNSLGPGPAAYVWDETTLSATSLRKTKRSASRSKRVPSTDFGGTISRVQPHFVLKGKVDTPGPGSFSGPVISPIKKTRSSADLRTRTTFGGFCGTGRQPRIGRPVFGRRDPPTPAPGFSEPKSRPMSRADRRRRAKGMFGDSSPKVVWPATDTRSPLNLAHTDLGLPVHELTGDLPTPPKRKSRHWQP